MKQYNTQDRILNRYPNATVEMFDHTFAVIVDFHTKSYAKRRTGGGVYHRDIEYVFTLKCAEEPVHNVKARVLAIMSTARDHFCEKWRARNPKLSITASYHHNHWKGEAGENFFHVWAHVVFKADKPSEILSFEDAIAQIDEGDAANDYAASVLAAKAKIDEAEKAEMTQRVIDGWVSGSREWLEATAKEATSYKARLNALQEEYSAKYDALKPELRKHLEGEGLDPEIVDAVCETLANDTPAPSRIFY